MYLWERLLYVHQLSIHIGKLQAAKISSYCCCCTGQRVVNSPAADMGNELMEVHGRTGASVSPWGYVEALQLSPQLLPLGLLEGLKFILFFWRNIGRKGVL